VIMPLESDVNYMNRETFGPEINTLLLLIALPVSNKTEST